jgi:hypothetical protein
VKPVNATNVFRLPKWRRQARISIGKPSPQKLKAPPTRPAAGVLQVARIEFSFYGDDEKR